MNNEQNIFNQIYNQTVAPPPVMWSRIERKLDELEHENVTVAPVVSIDAAKKSNSNWLKVALAACSLALIAMTAMWMIEKNNKENKNLSANNTNADTTILKKDNSSVASTPFIQNEPQGTEVPNNVLTPSNPSLNNNANDISRNNTILERQNSNTTNNTTDYNNTANANKINNSGKVNSDISKNQNATSNQNINNTNQTELPINNPPKNIDEVSYLDPSQTVGPLTQSDKTIGNILTRISINDDKEELDSIIQRSGYWKQQINLWRQQLLKSGYTPSIINNLDIIELKKMINTKQPKSVNK